MSTPEERLARIMRTEYRKTEYPKIRAEQAFVVSSIGFVGPCYVITPTIAVLDSTFAYTNRTNTKVETTLQVPYDESYVPEYLKVRGITAVNKRSNT